MSLDTEIPPGGTVDVDMVWCENRHPTNEHNMQNVVAEAGGEPSCLAKFNDDHTVLPRDPGKLPRLNVRKLSGTSKRPVLPRCNISGKSFG